MPYINGEWVQTEQPLAGSTFRMSAGGPAPGQAIKFYNGKVATSTSVVTTIALETVPAGKTFYITDLYMTNDQATLIDVQVQSGGINIFRAACRDIAPIQMAGIESQPSCPSASQVNIVLPITTSIQNFWFFASGMEQ